MNHSRLLNVKQMKPRVPQSSWIRQSQFTISYPLAPSLCKHNTAVIGALILNDSCMIQAMHSCDTRVMNYGIISMLLAAVLPHFIILLKRQSSKPDKH